MKSAPETRILYPPGAGKAVSAGERLNQVIAKKYRIDAFIGAGGAGVVYAATHLLTQEQVAIKFLRDAMLGDEQHKARFLLEARTVATMHHRNVVRLLDADFDEEHGLYMVLELLHGESLQDRIDRSGALALGETCELLLPIMHALSRAHARGMIHRDIKPDNIFLSRDDEGAVIPKLLDFGLARVLTSETGLNTATGEVLGTPTHMAPEQARGIKGVSAAADVWSMAATLYECLAGIGPFEHSDMRRIVLAVTGGEYMPLDQRCPDLPRVRQVQQVLAKALVVDPKARTADMSSLATQLAHAAGLDHDGLLARRGLSPTPSSSARGPSMPSMRPWPLIALGAGLSMLLIAMTYLAVELVRQQQTPATSTSAPAPTTTKPEAPSEAPERTAQEEPPNPANASGAAKAPAGEAVETDKASERPSRPQRPKQHDDPGPLDLGEILVH